jgi:sulfite oxidase
LTSSASNLVVHNAAPLNAETPLTRLRSAFLTGADDFYIRSHGNTPDLAGTSYRLTVSGDAGLALSLGLDDLKSRFEQHRVTASLQCAGNRRADFLDVRPVTGEPWGAGAIGTAEWTGAALRDLLHAAGVATPKQCHVAFQGADEVDTGVGSSRFAASIPIEKALADEVLVAYAMNGKPLARPHGAPVRLLVPGYAGARSVKWLTGIQLRNDPSESVYQQRDYKLFPPWMSQETVDYARGSIIYEMPLNSAICTPAAGEGLAPGTCAMRGYAIAGGRTIARVDVSTDGGREWQGARIVEQTAGPWAWSFWAADVELSPGEHELAVRAWDSAGQTQPARPDDVWNFKGYLCACWHRVRVQVRPSR